MICYSSSSLEQRGALFGLDARIAMAVFAVLSLVAGYSIVNNLDSSRAKSLSHELSEMARGVEAIHSDLRVDIFDALEESSEKNAFAALFDNMVIKETDNLRGRWLGPYVTYTTTAHPKYGDMVVQRHSTNHTQECVPDETCYLWVVYSKVKMPIAKEVNEIMDGTKENDPATEGRVQWTADNENAVLFYRAAKSIKPVVW